ncbi:hypothetical protein [Candidatus Finniella inopinata]|uniref:Uncharacterized protein n=1 Tax=Candidatus Finniella inopinata TaxID=1696036 RepID=A0A4Q7DG70_9PROT|nr:hypothetical protein [Candidatus Finniella inopinata]RZI45135.1 hypothetical protein EQU50_08120 [Candidatus Finniella inopinata]
MTNKLPTFRLLNILVLLQTLAYVTIGSNKVRSFMCLILTGCYLFRLPLSEYVKIKNLFLVFVNKRLKLFDCSILKEMPLRSLWVPAWFGIASFLAAFILALGGLFKSFCPYRNYGLYIPVLLLWATHLSFLVNCCENPILSKAKNFLFETYRHHPQSTKLLILSSYLVSFLLALGLFFIAFKSKLYDLGWNGFGFYDKRNVYWSYQVITVVLLFILFFIYAFRNKTLITVARVAAAQQSSMLVKIFKPGLVLMIGLFLWGPPWNIFYLLNAPDTHEVVHLGSIQAIKQGKIPFTEAEIQYGPGSQLFHYLYMKFQTFDLLSFRESCFLLHGLFCLFFLACLFCYLTFFQAFTTLWMSLIGLSSITLFGFDSNGLPAGLWGWFNGFRYCGAVFLALSLGHVLFHPRLEKTHTFLVGVTFGFLCYMAQENVSCGLMTLGLCLIFSLSVKLLDLTKALILGSSFCLGFLCFWSPIIIYYNHLGQLTLFLERYFAVSSLVVQGFSNTPWSSGWSNSYFLGYILTPVLFIYVGISLLYRRPLHKKIEFSATEVKIIFVLMAAIALHQVSLFRADDSHFKATLLALPILLVLFGEHLYKQSYRKELIGFCFSIIFIYPINVNLSSISSVVHNCIKRYQPIKDTDQAIQLFFDRFGFSLSPTQQGCSYSNLSHKRHMEEMKELKALIGDRPTIVTPIAENMTSGIYFFADLTVGTSMTEFYHSLINTHDRVRFLKQVANNVYSCLIVENIESEEAKIFLKRFPCANIKKCFYQKPYYVLLAD